MYLLHSKLSEIKSKLKAKSDLKFKHVITDATYVKPKVLRGLSFELLHAFETNVVYNQITNGNIRPQRGKSRSKVPQHPVTFHHVVIHLSSFDG
ncbi:hypothetical protein GJAV_G00260930 [Gymnothorax javanicus]|nr:hypothetical protein GJAV_G00260930 [Gymnothorax javanicus]